MSLRSRPRNPYRLLQFLRNLRQTPNHWFEPKLINKHNFWSNWHRADVSYWQRNAERMNWCDYPGCWEERDHPGDHVTDLFVECSEQE